MIGRRGRFIALAGAMGFFLCAQLAAGEGNNFATAFTSQALFDQVVTNWVFLACFYLNGFASATLFGAQTRIMDGALARANFMSIVTLWALFKFALIPIGAQLATLYPHEQFALLFALIWITYLVVDTFAEVGGSLYGTGTGTDDFTMATGNALICWAFGAWVFS
jgi:hypothetical protein